MSVIGIAIVIERVSLAYNTRNKEFLSHIFEDGKIIKDSMELSLYCK